MMKKSAAFSNTIRPSTAKKQSPQQNSLINGMKKLAIETESTIIKGVARKEISLGNKRKT